MAIQKPQKPFIVNEQAVYPLTSSDQVIMDNGERLNATITKFMVPDYTASDYGKLLGCNAYGLKWVDSQSELDNAEEISF